MYTHLLLLTLIANMGFSFTPHLKYKIFHKDKNCGNFRGIRQCRSFTETPLLNIKQTTIPTVNVKADQNVLPRERILLFFSAQEVRKAKRLYNKNMEDQAVDFLVDFFGPNTEQVVTDLRKIFEQISDTNSSDVVRQNLIKAAKYYCDLPPFQATNGFDTRIEKEQLWMLAAEAFATVIVTLKPTPIKQQLIKTLLINFSLLPGSIDWLSTDWILGNDDYEYKLFDRQNMIDSLRLLKKWIPSEFIRRRSRRLLEKLSDDAISSLFQTVLAPLVWATPSKSDSAIEEWMNKRVLRRSFGVKSTNLLLNWVEKNFSNDELVGFIEGAYSLLPELSNCELLDKVSIKSLRKLAVIVISRLKFKREGNGFAKSPCIHFKPRELALVGFNGGYIPLYPTRTCMIQMLLHQDNFNYANCANLQERLISRYQMQGNLSKLSLDFLYNLVQNSLASSSTSDSTDDEVGTDKATSASGDDKCDDSESDGDKRIAQLNLISNLFDRVKGLTIEGILGPINSMQQIELADQATLDRLEEKLFEIIESDPTIKFISADQLISDENAFNFESNRSEEIVESTRGKFSSGEKFSLNALPKSLDHISNCTAVDGGKITDEPKLVPDKLCNSTESINGGCISNQQPITLGDGIIFDNKISENESLSIKSDSCTLGDNKFALFALPKCLGSKDQLLELGKVSKWQQLLSPSLTSVAECIVGGEPTEIQKLAIPQIVAGKNVFICGGYGKTLAAALPLVQRLKLDEQRDWTVRQMRRPRMLVIAPSRELCQETLSVYKSIGHIEKISCECLAGGKWFGKQRRDNDKLIDVVIGTPSRILRHSMTKNNIRLDNVRFVVLDEFDELVAGGYAEELEALFKMMSNFQIIATAAWNVLEYPQFTEIAKKFTKYLKNLSTVYDCSLHKSPCGAVHQFLTKGKRGKRDKIGVLIDELKWGRNRVGLSKKYIVFCNTISSCRAVLHSLVEVGFDAMGFYGEVPLLQRKHNYERFCNEGGILVTTQARGLNFFGNDTSPISVINFDFPKSWIDYIIRSNRCRGYDSGYIMSLVDTKSKYLALGISRSIKANLPLKGLSRHKSSYNPLTGRLRYLTQSGGYFKILNEIRKAEIEGDGTFDIYKIISRLHDREANPRKMRSVRLSLEHEYRRRRRIFRVLLHKLKLIKRWNRVIRLKHKLLHKMPLLGWKRPKFPSMKKEAPIRKAMARVIQHLGTNYNYKTHERNLMLTKKLVKKHLKVTRHLLALLRSHKLDTPAALANADAGERKGSIGRKLRIENFKKFFGDNKDKRVKRPKQCVLI